MTVKACKNMNEWNRSLIEKNVTNLDHSITLIEGYQSHHLDKEKIQKENTRIYNQIKEKSLLNNVLMIFQYKSTHLIIFLILLVFFRKNIKKYFLNNFFTEEQK
jgi:hypothetical protein